MAFTIVQNAANVRSIVKSQSKQKYQLVCMYILFFYSQLHVYISVNILFLEAKRLLLTAIQKPLVGMTKQKDDATPTSSNYSSPALSSSPGSKGAFSGKLSPQIKTEDDLPNFSGGIAEDQFVSQQVVVDDGMFSRTTTHEFAGKIDAPRTSSFGKMDAYNFKGALVSEVEDAIAAANASSIAQYFGGVDVVYKQAYSNNTMITPLFCPCRIVLEGFAPTVIVCLVLEKGMTYAITAKYNTFNEFKQLNPRNRVIIHNEFTKNNPISMTHDFSEEEIRMFSHALSELLNLRLPVDILQGLYIYIFYQQQPLLLLLININ